MEQFWAALQRKPVVSIGAPLGTAPALLINQSPGFSRFFNISTTITAIGSSLLPEAPPLTPNAQERRRLFLGFLAERALS